MKRLVAATVGGFTPVFDELVANEDIGNEGALVFGRMWRYCQMRDGVCRASTRTIAEGVGLSQATVSRRIAALIEHGYLVDTTPDRGNVVHIYADTEKVKMRIAIDSEESDSQRITFAKSDSQRITSDSQRIKREDKKEIKRGETRKRVITLPDESIPPNMRNQSKPKKRKAFKRGGWKGYDPLPENRAPSVKAYRRIFPKVKLDRREVKVIANWKDVDTLKAVLMDWRKVVIAKHWSPKNWQAIGERYEMKDAIIATPAKNSQPEPKPVYN